MPEPDEPPTPPTHPEEAAVDRVTNSFRMDVIHEVVEVNPETGTVEFYVRPDPRRYEWRETGGKRHLYDRFDNIAIDADLVMQMLRKTLEIKPLPQPQLLGSATEYVALRAETIRQHLRGEVVGAPLADPAAAALHQFVGKRHLYVALVMDIKDSTKLARAVDVEVMARMVETISNEISAVLPAFYGNVLKYTGDGLIAIFAAPNFIRMNDHALDCALTVRHLVYQGLNPAFVEWGYPPIEIRIGIEAGEGIATVLGDPGTKRSIDLVGNFIGMAAKLQASAPPGGIYLGYICERNLYIEWRQQVVRVDMSEATWNYKDDQGDPYAVYAAPARHS